MDDDRLVGGLRCSEVLEALDLYVAGELDDDTLAAVQRHVGECQRCARFGAAYAKVVAQLRDRAQEHPVRNAVVQQVLDQLV